MTDMERLNRRIAEWAGFEQFGKEGEYWVFKPAPDYQSFEVEGTRWITPKGDAAFAHLPDFPHDLNACVEHLFPLVKHYEINNWNGHSHRAFVVLNNNRLAVADADKPALAFCLALDKLVVGKGHRAVFEANPPPYEGQEK